MDTLLSFPSLSDSAWDSTLSRRCHSRELDEQHSHGSLVLQALLEQSLRRTATSLTDLEYLREVLLSDDVPAFLLSKAGVYELATGNSSDAAWAFLVFVCMAVNSSGGIREFEQWFERVFDPLVLAISQTQRTRQEPRGNKRSALYHDLLPSKRRRTEMPSLPSSASTFAILERLRQRQNLCASDTPSETQIVLHESRPAETNTSHVVTPLSPERDLISLASFSTCPSFSISISADDNLPQEEMTKPSTPAPSTLTDSNSTTLLPAVQASTPESADSIAADPLCASDGPLTPPATDDDLLQAAEQFIRETIEMVKRGELLPTPAPQPSRSQKRKNRKKKADASNQKNACLMDVSNIPQSQSRMSVDSDMSKYQNKKSPTDMSNTPQKQPDSNTQCNQLPKHKPIPVHVSKENVDPPAAKKNNTRRRKGPLSGGVKLGVVSPSTSAESLVHSDS